MLSRMDEWMNGIRIPPLALLLYNSTKAGFNLPSMHALSHLSIFFEEMFAIDDSPEEIA
jgi:hypothetical protein